MRTADIIIIGGGPAGLAAAVSAHHEGAEVVLIEREARLGGILKQCIHDGFGLIRFGEKLSGPEYVERFIEAFEDAGIEARCLTFVTALTKKEGMFFLSAVSRQGVEEYCAKALILATGCRERTAKQVRIHGTRPAGIMTAGTAQHFVNLRGKLPGRKCVILGSGDIGLIMARRLTLEGAEVLGVYEVKPTPSGLTRNIAQCLDDYHIPLYLSHTVTRVFGEDRLEAVEIAEVDSHMKPVQSSVKKVACDALILSVGLIPENEMAEKLGVKIDSCTKGPVCDSDFMTSVEGVFSCGNALHVNDLVDYVSESGEFSGTAAARYALGQGEEKTLKEIEIQADGSLLYIVPQRLAVKEMSEKIVFYFRSREVLKAGTLVFSAEGRELYRKKYKNLKPPEMERLELDSGMFKEAAQKQVSVHIEKEG